MANNIDQTLGMQLNADFATALQQMERVCNLLDRMERKLQNIATGTKGLSAVTNAVNKLNKLNAGNLETSLDGVLSNIKEFNDQLQKMNTSAIDKMADSFERLMKAMDSYSSRFKSMTTLPSGSVSIKNSSLSRSNRQISTALDQIAPLRAKTEEASKSLRSMDKDASRLGNTLRRTFTVGNLIYFKNMLTSVGRGFFNMLNLPIEFAETENVFTAAFGRMRDEAYQFGEDLSEAFGLALPPILQMEATFKNMLGSLGGLTDETSTMISEVMTKMTVDFSSLYNVSIEQAAQKMQSALSRQVRPIRSTSGYDITQNVLGGTAESIGITDRTISQMNEMEKRLLIIITLQNQMARSSALGDFGNTIENTANQLKIMQQQISEVGRWIGSVFAGTIGKVLPYINGFLFAIKEIVKSLAFLVGYEMPNSSGVDRNILDQMDSGVEDVNTALDDTNNSLGTAIKKTKEWKNFLASFDVANVIPDQTSSDTGPSGGSSGGVASDFIDPRILAALQDYDNLMYSVRMKAYDIRDALLDAFYRLGSIINDRIFQPITKSWEKYGQPIIDNIQRIGADIGHILESAISVVSEKWDPFFQSLSDLFFSLMETATLLGSTISNGLRIAWDMGGKVLFEGIFNLVTSLLNLATSINDNFVKPLINAFNNTLGPVISGVIGMIMGVLGEFLDFLSNIINFVADCSPLVSGLGAAFTTLFLAFKAAKFVTWVSSFKSWGDALSRAVDYMYDHNKLFKKLVDAFITGQSKVSGVVSVFDKFNDVIANTKVWKTFSGLLEKGVKSLEGFASKAKGSDSTLKNLAGTITSKLGQALSWLAQHPAVAVVTAIGVVVGAVVALSTAMGDSEKSIEDCSEAIQGQYDEYMQLADAIDQAKVSAEQQVAANQVQIDMVDSYIQKLREMTDENGFVENIEGAKYLIEEINQILPDTFAITEEGQIVQKKSNEEIERSIDLYKKQADAQAYQQAYVAAKQTEIEMMVAQEQTLNRINELNRQIADYEGGRSVLSVAEYAALLEERDQMNILLEEQNAELEKATENVEYLGNAYEQSIDSMSDSNDKLAASTKDLEKVVEAKWEDIAEDIKKSGESITEEDEKMYKTMLTNLEAYGLDTSTIQGRNYINMLNAAKEFGIDLNSENGKMYTRALALLDDYGYDVTNEQLQQHAARLITAAENGDEEGKKFVEWLKSGVSSDDIDPEIKKMMDSAQSTADKNKPKVTVQTESSKTVANKLARVIPNNLVATVKLNLAFNAITGVVGNVKSAITKAIRGYAVGGFPDVGQMFIARESGPEFVGTMGGKTAVANNYQIENGIYRAVKAAMSGFNKPGGDLHITINNEDGTKIEKIIKNYNDYITRNGGNGGFKV